jgi:hypothetical protein
MCGYSGGTYLDSPVDHMWILQWIIYGYSSGSYVDTPWIKCIYSNGSYGDTIFPAAEHKETLYLLWSMSGNLLNAVEYE